MAYITVELKLKKKCIPRVVRICKWLRENSGESDVILLARLIVDDIESTIPEKRQFVDIDNNHKDQENIEDWNPNQTAVLKLLSPYIIKGSVYIDWESGDENEGFIFKKKEWYAQREIKIWKTNKEPVTTNTDIIIDDTVKLILLNGK